MQREYDSSAGPPMPAEVLRTFGYLGHYLRTNTGGRGGKQFVLVALEKEGGNLTQKDLFERSSTSSAAMSEVLSKLEAEGLITRTTSEADRRQLDVQLTRQGHKRARALVQEREAFEAEALSCLTEDELYVLKKLTDKIADHWKRLEKEEVSV